MSVPSELAILFENYQEILRSDEDSMLNPYHRVEFYKKIQTSSTLSQKPFLQWLQVVTAQHVLPIARWFLPYNLKPEPLLQASIDFLSNIISEDEGLNHLYYAGDLLSNFSLEAAPPAIIRAFHVYEAAMAALSWCVAFSGLPDFEESDNNEDWMDPDADAANWACAAYAGAFWDDSDYYDSEKGLEFWEWWLTEAVPSAWELAARQY